MLNAETINTFRDYINSNDFTLFTYKKHDNKNLWGCICSAMDWITVSVDYLQRYSKGRSLCNESIAAFAFISCVDIIVEAIEQLHRVIFSTRNRVFDNTHDCFSDNIFGLDDRAYFKTIRACFGAHPVNLDEPGNSQNKGEKRFASWSGSFGGGDFSVILYSNQIGGKDIYLNISFSQLLSYAEKYYNHLNILMQELDSQYLSFCSQLRNTPFSCEGTALSRLYALKAESMVRLDNDYYRTTINDLITLFETPISNEKNKKIAIEYRRVLQSAIDEIQQNLQNMVFSDLKCEELLSPHPKSLPNGWGYWFSKLSDAAHGTGYHPLFWEQEIERIFSGYIAFPCESAQELYVIVRSVLYQLSQEEKVCSTRLLKEK